MIRTRTKPANPDRILPHSDEAERGVLGCILIDPKDCLPEAQTRIKDPDSFYDLRHRTIYDTMCSMANNGGIDIITLQQKLRDRGMLDNVGGTKFLARLMDDVPSALNLCTYTDIMSEKFTLRRVISTCTEAVARAYECQGKIPDLLDQVSTDVFNVINQTGSAGQEYWSIKDLNAYDTDNDPNAVIGYRDCKTTRYLCKGYGGWIIGQSGIGKSAITHQQAYLFAMGMDFCGITPIKPLRVLIVQSENDIGDNAEACQGILNSIPNLTTSLISKINQNVRVVRCRGKTGPAFCHWLQREIKSWKSDLCYVDPLLRFAGIDVSRQDQCTQFLNNHLDPVLANTGVVLLGAHHTGKPKNARETKGWTIYDHAYAGIGSSELVNWARAITIVRVIPEGGFELILSKRGSRAWATHPNGDPTTSIFMRHSNGRIFWEQTDPPEISQPSYGPGKTAGRKSKVDEIATSNLHDFCASCLPAGEGLNEISRRLEVYLANNRNDASRNTCKRAVAALVANAKISKGEDGLYRKGPEA